MNEQDFILEMDSFGVHELLAAVVVAFGPFVFNGEELIGALRYVSEHQTGLALDFDESGKWVLGAHYGDE